MTLRTQRITATLISALLIMAINPGVIAQARSNERTLPPTQQARTWEGTLGNDANSSFKTKLRVSYVQHQRTLTGELFGYDQKTSQYLRIGPIKGSIDGNSAQWSLITPDGHGTMNIRGTFNGNTFTGRHTTTVSGGGTAKGNLTLTRRSTLSTTNKPSTTRTTTAPAAREPQATSAQVATTVKSASQKAKQKSPLSKRSSPAHSTTANSVRAQTQGARSKATTSQSVSTTATQKKAAQKSMPTMRPNGHTIGEAPKAPGNRKQPAGTSTARTAGSQGAPANKVRAQPQGTRIQAAASPITRKSASKKAAPARTPQVHTAAKEQMTASNRQRATPTSALRKELTARAKPADRTVKPRKEIAKLRPRNEQAVQRARASTLRVEDILRTRTTTGQP